MQLTWFSCWDFAVRLDLCVIVVIGAVMLRVQPREHMIWATVIIVFSAVSLVGMGGFFIGAILGIIDGAFALSFRQTNP
ncbi:MAG: DUF6114 domain-containing protein [Candidatus Bathyarchaeia archaeon]